VGEKRGTTGEHARRARTPVRVVTIRRPRGSFRWRQRLFRRRRSSIRRLQRSIWRRRSLNHGAGGISSLFPAHVSAPVQVVAAAQEVGDEARVVVELLTGAARDTATSFPVRLFLLPCTVARRSGCCGSWTARGAAEVGNMCGGGEMRWLLETTRGEGNGKHCVRQANLILTLKNACHCWS
jgi:hypothetical protein